MTLNTTLSTKTSEWKTDYMINGTDGNRREREAADRILKSAKMELRKIWQKQRKKTKHDRMTRIEQSYRILESNLELLVVDEGLQAWELAVRTHWSLD
jgi:hypothetical protein